MRAEEGVMVRRRAPQIDYLCLERGVRHDLSDIGRGVPLINVFRGTLLKLNCCYLTWLTARRFLQEVMNGAHLRWHFHAIAAGHRMTSG